MKRAALTHHLLDHGLDACQLHGRLLIFDTVRRSRGGHHDEVTRRLAVPRWDPTCALWSSPPTGTPASCVRIPRSGQPCQVLERVHRALWGETSIPGAHVAHPDRYAKSLGSLVITPSTPSAASCSILLRSSTVHT